MNWIGVYTLIRKELSRNFRIIGQNLISPWISALLYILIFGQIVGSRIGEISGVQYIDFVLPGLVVMNIMTASFMQTSHVIFFHKFVRTIEELLAAPISYFEFLLANVATGIIRGLLVGGGVYAIGLFFTVASVDNFLMFLFYSITISVIFSLAGLLIGIWAKGFEHLSIPSTFIIMPLTFLGGVFNSIHMLPEKFQVFVRLNPFFYFVDGIRYSMVGISESNLMLGWGLIVGLIVVLGSLAWYLFNIGWRLRS
jgi:ABC-2 type transport system permease protein